MFLQERLLHTGDDHLALGHMTIRIVQSRGHAKPAEQLIEPRHVERMRRSRAESPQPKWIERHVQGNQAVFWHIYDRRLGEAACSESSKGEEHEGAAAQGVFGLTCFYLGLFEANTGPDVEYRLAIFL